MTLQEWVGRIGGPVGAARKLRVSPQRVRNWLRKECKPNPELMLRIVKASAGEVTIEEIVLGANR